MSKIHLYSPIIHEIALFQTLKKNYAVNGHGMYCTCVLFTCALLTMDTYSHRVTNSKRLYDKMQWDLHYYFIVQYLMQVTYFFCDLTMTTNHLNMS